MTSPPQPPDRPEPGQPLGMPVRATASVPAPPATPAPPLVVSPGEANTGGIPIGAGGASGTTGSTPAAAATAAGTAQPAAAAAPAAAGPAPPGDPSTGDADGPVPPESGRRWRARRHRRLHRLRIGRHAAPAEALEDLQLRYGSIGLRLGRGQRGEPVTLRLFRPHPTRVVLLGGGSAADLVTTLALRFGARVAVFTHEPAGWLDLGQRVTGRTDRVAVLRPGDAVGNGADGGDAVRMAASADSPVLRVYAAGHPPGNLPQWTTSLMLVPPVTVAELAVRPDRVSTLAAADVILAQRLAVRDVAVLQAVLRFSPQVRDALPTLPDGALAVLTRTGTRYAWTEPISDR